MTPSRHTNSRTRTNRVAGKQLATGGERGEEGIKEEEKGERERGKRKTRYYYYTCVAWTEKIGGRSDDGGGKRLNKHAGRRGGGVWLNLSGGESWLLGLYIWYVTINESRRPTNSNERNVSRLPDDCLVSEHLFLIAFNREEAAAFREKKERRRDRIVDRSKICSNIGNGCSTIHASPTRAFAQFSKFHWPIPLSTLRNILLKTFRGEIT